MRCAAFAPRLLVGLLVGLLPVLLLAACGAEAPLPAAAPAAAPAKEEGARVPPTVTTAWRGEGTDLRVSVWEMHCPGCEIEVEQVLEPIPGVAAVRASWETSEVRIDVAEGTPREEVIARIREAVHENGRLILGEDPVER